LNSNAKAQKQLQLMQNQMLVQQSQQQQPSQVNKQELKNTIRNQLDKMSKQIMQLSPETLRHQQQQIASANQTSASFHHQNVSSLHVRAVGGMLVLTQIISVTKSEKSLRYR